MTCEQSGWTESLHFIFRFCGRWDCVDAKLFHISNKFFGRLECRNKMLGNVNSDVLLYVATDFSSSFFGYETAEAPYLNVFTFG